MTQKQLAEAAGLKEGGVRDLEQGRRMPSWETILALAKALGVDCTAFTTKPAAGAESPRPRGRPRSAATQMRPAPAGTPPRTAKGKRRRGSG